MLMKTENMAHVGNSTSVRSVLSYLNVGRCMKGLKIWLQHSRQRRALAKLDDRLLDDIGLSTQDVKRETSKPFWL
ncbi:MAG: DUF1127 domain-containing protein [Magnetovibrio sp.]|nr:DUF1127 domain-containing protein [Magnetovibrio sp.]